MKSIDKKYYSSDYYDVRLNKYGVKCDTSLRFWENKDPHGSNGILDNIWVEEVKMIKDK